MLLLEGCQQSSKWPKLDIIVDRFREENKVYIR